MTFKPKLKSVLALAAALALSIGAQAAVLTSATISGTTAAFNINGTANSDPLATVLGGTATAPGSNIQLGSLGVATGTLTGMVGGHSVTLQSLTFADWFTPAGGVTLAEKYIQSAATAFGITIADMADTVNKFKTLDVLPGVGVLNPWQFVSDPNISYVADGADGLLHVGLAGYYDATAFLTGLFGNIVPAAAQASEVVKITIDGGTSQYLYSFSATNVRPGFETSVYSGNYDVRVIPEPGSLALIGLGLAGMAALRRRKSKQA